MAASSALAPALEGAKPCPDADGFTCSTLTVPIDHRNRTGGTLRLAVAVQDRPHATHDLIVLAGGPGQPGVPYAAALARITETLPDYRMVMIDQRGTGATALDCPKLQVQMGEAGRPPTAGALRECLDALGANARFYRTADTVADLDDLRAALGAETVSVDGVSYGSYVAEQYAIAHPRRVDRLVLDSVVPDTGAEPLALTPTRATARVLRAACATRDCPGDPAADLATVARARSDGGAEILGALGMVGYQDPDYTGIPELLHQAANGNPKPLDDGLAGMAQGDAPAPQDYSAGLNVATLCADEDWPWRTAESDLAHRQRMVERILDRLPASAAYPFNGRTALRNGIMQACLRWPNAPLHEPIGRMPHVPTLLLGGDRDLLTPVEWLRQEARRVPDPTVVVVPDASHSLQLHSPAGLAAARDFLARD